MCPENPMIPYTGIVRTQSSVTTTICLLVSCQCTWILRQTIKPKQAPIGQMQLIIIISDIVMPSSDLAKRTETVEIVP